MTALLYHATWTYLGPTSTAFFVKANVFCAALAQPLNPLDSVCCLQVYSVQDSPLCLTGTAEVPLGAMYMDQILSEDQLPIKMAGFGHCFRTEAGAGGKHAQ